MTVPLDPAQVSWIGERFLDPTGRVFLHEGEYYRAIYLEKVEHVRRLFSEGIVEKLVGEGWLVGTELSDRQVTGYGLVLKHQGAPFRIGPGFWSRSVIRDAARCFIGLNRALLPHGLGTVDGHSGNFLQVGRCQPVWLDFGSIVPLQQGDEGMEEFRSGMVNPLRLFARSSELGAVARAILREGGLDDEQAAALGGWGHRLRARGRRLWRAASGRWPGPLQPSLVRRRSALLDREEARLPADFPPLRTYWKNYHLATKVLDEENPERPRGRQIQQLLRQLKPRRLIDIGANEGFFSLMAAREGIETLSLDYDEGATENFYARSRQWPAHLSLSCACASIMHRYMPAVQADCVLALALTHHLLIGQKYELKTVARVLSGVSTGALITEYMPHGIGGGKMQADPLPAWYTFENFLAAFAVHFDRVEEVVYPDPEASSPRRLVLCQGKRPA